MKDGSKPRKQTKEGSEGRKEVLREGRKEGRKLKKEGIKPRKEVREGGKRKKEGGKVKE